MLKDKKDELLKKGFSVSKSFRLGKTSDSGTPKRRCPKCKNSLIGYNKILGQYFCSKCEWIWAKNNNENQS